MIAPEDRRAHVPPRYMKRLALLRHAHAEARQAWGGDAARRLTRRGAGDARAVSGCLQRARFTIDRVLCSTAERARATLAAIEANLTPPPAVLFEDGLYLASPATLMSLIRQTDDAAASLLVVGHNPGLQRLALAFAAHDPGDAALRLRSAFPTAALAIFDLDIPSWGEIGSGCGILRSFVTPRALRNRPPPP